MKKFRFLGWAILGIMSLFLISCSSVSPTAMGSGKAFNDDGSANVVLIYYGDKNIYMTRPDISEDGFMPLLSQKQVVQRVHGMKMGRDLAVVVVGPVYDSRDLLPPLVHQWEAALQPEGFKRVIFLRASRQKGIDGLPILFDSAIASLDVTPGKASIASAAFAPAP